MSFRRRVLLVGFLGAFAVSLPADAENQTPDDYLKAQGLRKVNQTYVLSDETAMTKRSREIDALRKKATDAQQKAVAAESKVEEKKKLLVDYAEKRRALRSQIENATSVDVRNRLITMSNELVDRSILLEKSDREEKEAASARAAAASTSEQYVELLLQLRKQYDQVEKTYDKLAADDKVRQALDDLNQDSEKPYKLGPTGTFALLDRNLKKLEAGVLSDTISLRRGDGNLWHVTVTFNGKSAQDMAIDTGASIISLPYKVAEAAGLTPSAQDPTIRVSLADGSVIEAKQVFAASVRLGKFTIEHVECAVMPADLPKAEPLLGLSFLKHFTFKIDSSQGTLLMCKIDQPEKGERRVTGRPGSREKGGASRDGKAGADQPTAEKEPSPKLEPAQQLVELLKTGDQPLPGGFTAQSPAGEIKFVPSKQEPVENLTKQFGQPDEIVKLPVKQKDGDKERELSWKLWSWGNVRVVVGEEGRTLFYAVTKD